MNVDENGMNMRLKRRRMNELIEYGDCIELNRKSEIIVIRVMRMKNVMMIGENCCNEVNLSCLYVNRFVDLK